MSNSLARKANTRVDWLVTMRHSMPSR
jgi:hypothetical protein